MIFFNKKLKRLESELKELRKTSEKQRDQLKSSFMEEIEVKFKVGQCFEYMDVKMVVTRIQVVQGDFAIIHTQYFDKPGVLCSANFDYELLKTYMEEQLKKC